MEALYDEGVVEHDDLEFRVIVGRQGHIIKVKLEGHVACAYGMRVRVLKWMDARRNAAGRTEVLSTFYQYNAWRPARGRKREQSLLRYDQFTVSLIATATTKRDG